MIDPLPQWIDAIAAIAPDKDSGAKKLADAIDQRVTGKLALALLGGPPAQFTWQPAMFANIIMNLPPSPDAVSGIMMLCNAWEAATMASTLVVTPGAFLGASAPPTLYSVVIASILLPPSIVAAKQVMFAALSTAVPIQDIHMSPLGNAVYSAFSALQAMVTGLNSVPPPPGPQPLIVVSPVL